MSRRLLAGALGTVALFALFLAFLFPTDTLVRRILVRALPPDWPGVVFEHAALRPDGIRLDGVTLIDSTGATVLKADRVHFRPSLRSLLRDGSGRPLTVAAELCHGNGEAVVTDDGPATVVALEWRDLDLATCPRLRLAGGTLEGLAAGTAHLRLAPPNPTDATGTIELREAVWQGMGRLAAVGALHAASATMRWRLGYGQLTVEALELTGPEVSANGNGQVELADPVPKSTLTLTLAVTPAAEAPGRIRFLFGLDGEPMATRHLTITGTLAAPNVLME